MPPAAVSSDAGSGRAGPIRWTRSARPLTVRRALLIAALVALLGFHALHASFRGDGGWWTVHDGLLGAIWMFFELSLADPVLSAGLSDFVVVALLFGVWMFTAPSAGPFGGLTGLSGRSPED